MKSIIAIVLSFCIAISPAMAADGQSAGEVKAIIPAASRNDAILKLKDALAWNDLLRTDAKGRLRAGLSDGSILSLGSNSQLRVLQHDAATQQTAIEVNYGKLRNQVVKITQPNGKYEVKTPNAVIGVIGTDFYVSYENNRTTVICYVGKVAVTPLSGAKILNSESGQGGSDIVTVAAGQMVVIGFEIPPAGYQPSETPRETAKTSLEDTNVPDQPPVVAKSSHFVRNLILATVVAAAGWTIGITQLQVNNPPPPPPPKPGCPPQNPKCG